jgi:hypothetical protein
VTGAHIIQGTNNSADVIITGLLNCIIKIYFVDVTMADLWITLDTFFRPRLARGNFFFGDER